MSWALAVQVIGLTLLAVRFALGSSRLAQCAFPICFFLVAVPWPYGIENPIIQGLTRMDTALTIEILGLIGIPAIQHGNVIELAAGSVGIDEACSGIRSLQATLMLSLFFGEFYRLSAARRVLCVLAGFALALACNLGRMLLLTWVAARRGEQAIAGWHDPAGVSILVACFVGLWLVGLGLKRKSEGSPHIHHAAHRGHEPACEVAQASSPASSPGVPPVGCAGSETLPQLAAGTVCATRFMESGARAGTRDAESKGASTLPGFHISRMSAPFSVFAALAIWLVVVEVFVAAWYRHIESDLRDSATWSITWPETEASFREVPIAKKAAEMLRYDSAKQAQWSASDGTRWQLSWFYWKPGKAAGYLAKSHNPLVCMPAAGYEVSSISPPHYAEVHGLRLPFRIYSFEQERSTVHILYTRWDDRALEQSFATEGVTRFNRLRSIWRGRGNHGQRVISLAVWGAHDSGQARDLLVGQLDQVVAVGVP